MKNVVLWLAAIMIGSFAIAFVLMISTGGGGLSFFSSGEDGFSKTIDHSISYDAEDYTSIKINTASADVKLIPTDGDEIDFHFYGEASISNEKHLPKLVVEPSGQSLTAKIEYPRIINFGVSFSRSKLDVLIPRKFIEDIEVSTASGSIHASDLKVKNFQAESASGKLSLDGLQTDKAITKTMSGSIQIEHFTGALQASSLSGKIYSQLDALDSDLNIKNTSGKHDAGFDMLAKSVSGKITHNFLADMKNSPGSKRTEAIVGSGEYDINLETVSGSILINHE